jgi:two-component system response regulator ResD
MDKIMSRMKKLKILIVDDNQRIRQMIRQICESYSMEIVECDNGDSALIEQKKLQPDLIIMDIEMEGMDGITTTRKMVDYNRESEVIILTSHNDQGLRQAAFSAGAFDYLVKEDLMELKQYLIIKSRNQNQVLVK